MPQFSIIVPVYKVETYLSVCVDSILGQTYPDFELILVDDGSPDRCGEICDEYAAVDPRVRVIHKENSGVSSARNCGIQCATGDWLWFVDSDDYVERNSLDFFSRLIQSQSAELYIFESDIKESFEGGLEEFLWKYYFTYSTRNSPWNKLYNNDLIQRNNLVFDEQESIGEDLLFNIHYYMALFDETRNKKVVFMDEHLYHYVDREGSAMNTASKERLSQQMRLFDKIKSIIHDKVSRKTIDYFFLLHWVSGVRQAKQGGLSSREYEVFFDPLRHGTHIKGALRLLPLFLTNENASISGRIRMYVFIRLSIIGSNKTAGKIMGLP